jgi:hypothetical protein
MNFWTFSMSAAALCLLVGCAVRTPEQRTQHDDTHYKPALRPYVRDLKPGMTRNEIEDYLNSRNISFGHGCRAAMEQKTNAPNQAYYYAMDDWIELREEVRPWPCGTADVYIAFAFDPERPYTSFADNRINPDDALTGIHIFKIFDCF